MVLFGLLGNHHLGFQLFRVVVRWGQCYIVVRGGFWLMVLVLAVRVSGTSWLGTLAEVVMVRGVS